MGFVKSPKILVFLFWSLKYVSHNKYTFFGPRPKPGPQPDTVYIIFLDPHLLEQMQMFRRRVCNKLLQVKKRCKKMVTRSVLIFSSWANCLHNFAKFWDILFFLNICACFCIFLRIYLHAFAHFFNTFLVQIFHAQSCISAIFQKICNSAPAKLVPNCN